MPKKERQLITIINDFAECLNQKGQCDILLLDFCRTFDKVAHNLFISKLVLLQMIHFCYGSNLFRVTGYNM